MRDSLALGFEVDEQRFFGPMLCELKAETHRCRSIYGYQLPRH